MGAPHILLVFKAMRLDKISMDEGWGGKSGWMEGKRGKGIRKEWGENERERGRQRETHTHREMPQTEYLGPATFIA